MDPRDVHFSSTPLPTMSTKSFFGPTTTEAPAAGSSNLSGAWNVTVPQVAEIVKPAAQLLEQLLPVATKPVSVVPSSSSGNTLVDALKKTQNQARTENNAEAYASTESATLDAFSGLNANSTCQDIHKQLAKSWEESPDLTLRIIWNMRSIHEGHSNKTGFYRAFGWLYKHHPRTAIENLGAVVERLCERKIKRKSKKNNSNEDDGFEVVEAEDEPAELTVKMPHGYYKDLLNIVVLAMRNELTDPDLDKYDSLNVPPIKRQTRTRKEWQTIKDTKKEQNEKLGGEEAKQVRGAESQKVIAAQEQKAKEQRKTKREADFALLKEKLEHDKSFLALYAKVAQIFADELANDVALLKRIEKASDEEAFDLKFELSSASKWAPTLEGFHDRATNISTAIALVMHARGHMSDLSLQPSTDLTQQNAHTLRGYYRRWIVSPLRRYVDVIEVKMSSREWDRINYKHVPSECMKKNKAIFFKHDEKRLTEYLADVVEGKSKISGATLLPHELLIEALKATPDKHSSGKKKTPEQAVKEEVERRLAESNKKVIEAQWNSLLERMRESGTLESSLALVDVSGSMGGITELPKKKSHVEPIFPAVSLGLLLGQLGLSPFKDMFITFSASPELLTFAPGGLAEQARWMVGTDWGMNTDYEAVFLKLLLPTAVKNSVKPEDMVKRLFVFSDMQFDASQSDRSDGAWETTHDRIVKAFKEAGYEMPEIVYWNLEGGTTKPVLQDTPGTALVTGFSANMMKLFMAGEKLEEEPVEIGPDGEEVAKKQKDPLDVMEKALAKACYDTLKVYD
ncbi:hypothetical protein BDV93DRAFT_519910 [Ceratobasidium sp. AG-I]|nr:hypothetical protein BDV93DRAFT_519910 [Ceratobasidium sp. AG-I]